jgi:hypothetical protein
VHGQDVERGKNYFNDFGWGKRLKAQSGECEEHGVLY